MIDDQGNITTEHESMADLLRNHWSQVCSHKDTTKANTKRWFEKAYPKGPPCKAAACRWKPTRQDLMRAIKIANASSPGPDGIPYLAWQKSGPLATHILWKAMNSMYTDEDITDHYPEFNEAILVCLPKKATTTTKDGQAAYHSDSTRPLAISNTDNRLIASTFRLRWERLAAQHIHPHQRG